MKTSNERYITREAGLEILKHEKEIYTALIAIIENSKNKPEKIHSITFKPSNISAALSFRARLLSESNIRLDQNTGYRYVTLNNNAYYLKDIKSVS